MTTPAAFATPERIIRFAMKDAGLLQDGDDPTSEQIAEYMNRLNDLINYLTVKGIKLWTWLDQSITLVAGQATYTFMPGGSVNITKPLRAISCIFRDTNSIDRQLTCLSWDEYQRLSDKSAQGAINSYFANELQSSLSLTFWLVPDATAATGTVHALIQQQITNNTMLTDTMNFPQEWFLPLRWLLADEICTGQPQAIMDRCQAKAAMYMEVLENWDVEDTNTTFTPDGRSNGSSSFR